MKMQITKAHCFRCNEDWAPNKEEVKRCPFCKSLFWHVKEEVKRGWPKGKKRKLV